MRRRTITRLAIAGPVALILGLSAATAAQASGSAPDGTGPYAFESATPDWTFTL